MRLKDFIRPGSYYFLLQSSPELLVYLGPGRCRRVPDLRDQSVPGPKKLDPAAGLGTPRPQEALGGGVWGQNLSRTSVVGRVCVLGVGQEEDPQLSFLPTP